MILECPKCDTILKKEMDREILGERIVIHSCEKCGYTELSHKEKKEIQNVR